MVVFFFSLHIATAALVLAGNEFLFWKKKTSRKKYTFQFNGIFQITYVLTPLARRHTEHQTTKYNNSTKSSRKKTVKRKPFKEIWTNIKPSLLRVHDCLCKIEKKIIENYTAYTSSHVHAFDIKIDTNYFKILFSRWYKVAQQFIC